MDEKFLIDTNIIIYYLKDEIPTDHIERVEHILETSFHISTITKIELLGWQAIPLEEKRKLEEFLQAAHVIYIDKTIEDKVIELKQRKKLPIPDAVIGATAFVYNYTIVTRNESDFEKIKGLNVYNPFG